MKARPTSGYKTMNSSIYLTVIMPALNEQENVEAAMDSCLKSFARYNIEGEIIVVDDGSTDRTPEIVSFWMRKETRISLITHSEVRGMGASFWDGVMRARGQAVTMIPGDNENEPAEIIKYIGLLQYVDMIIPFVCNKDVRSRTRNFLSRMYTSILNLTLGMSLHYFNGTVLYKKSALAGLNPWSRGFFFQAEILAKAIKKGYLFAEVPYCLRKRRTRGDKSVSFSSFFDVGKCYFRLIRDIYKCGK